MLASGDKTGTAASGFFYICCCVCCLLVLVIPLGMYAFNNPDTERNESIMGSENDCWAIASSKEPVAANTPDAINVSEEFINYFTQSFICLIVSIPICCCMHAAQAIFNGVAIGSSKLDSSSDPSNMKKVLITSFVVNMITFILGVYYLVILIQGC